MKILLKDLKQAEKEYANAIIIWGENNQITIRALIKYQDLKYRYEIQKKGN